MFPRNVLPRIGLPAVALILALSIPWRAQGTTWELLATRPHLSWWDTSFLGTSWVGVPLCSFDFGGSFGTVAVGNADTIIELSPKAECDLDTDCYAARVVALQWRSVEMFDPGFGRDYYFLRLLQSSADESCRLNVYYSYVPYCGYPLYDQFVAFSYSLRKGSLDGPEVHKGFLSFGIIDAEVGSKPAPGALVLPGINGGFWAQGYKEFYGSGDSGTTKAPVRWTADYADTSLPSFRLQVQPVDVTACLNSSVEFSVCAEEGFPFGYQWRHNGVAIPGANGKVYAINGVQVADGGWYDVVPINGACVSGSNVARLIVQTPVWIAAHPRGGSIRPGDTLTLSVIAPGNPAPFFQWRRNELPLEDGGRVAGATTAKLTITAVAFEDEGWYDVVVSNACGTATSGYARIAVVEPPVEISAPVLKGRKLHCEFRAEPGRLYVVQSSADLAVWDYEFIPAVTAGTVAVDIPVDGPANRRFYRVLCVVRPGTF